jgi:hypothetical protein
VAIFDARCNFSRFHAIRSAVNVEQLRAAESEIRRYLLVVLLDQLEILLAKLFHDRDIRWFLLFLRERRVDPNAALLEKRTVADTLNIRLRR